MEVEEGGREGGTIVALCECIGNSGKQTRRNGTASNGTVREGRSLGH